MQDYSKYEIKDFLTDEAFCRWVIRRMPADDVFWENWIRKNSDRARIVASARELILDIHHANDYLSEEEFKEELNRISFARKNQETEVQEVEVRRGWVGKMMSVLAVAACTLIFYHFYSGYQSRTDKFEGLRAVSSEKGGELIEIHNKETFAQTYKLSDSSTVLLSPKSRLGYSREFGRTIREVFLNGEAFFQVTKNPDKPFKVYTRDIVTTVLGTSFSVKAFENDSDVRVVVKTGKVTVSTAPGNKGEKKVEADELVLLPNQQVVYHREDNKLKRSLVENPVEIGSAGEVSQNMIFDRTPVPKVFEALQKRYGVQIVYDADLLAGCQLTAELGQEPLLEKLGLICRAIQARYELIDGQIIVHGTSCK